MDTVDNQWMTPEEALSRFAVHDLFQIHQSESTRDNSQLKYTFIINNIGFIINEGVLCEVFKDYSIFPLPNCPEWINGLVNIRGSLVPVFSLNEFLGETAAVNDGAHLLIIDTGIHRAGVLIDQLPIQVETNNWQSQSLKIQLDDRLSPYITKSYLVGECFWLELDHRSFFTSLNNHTD